MTPQSTTARSGRVGCLGLGPVGAGQVRQTVLSVLKVMETLMLSNGKNEFWLWKPYL